jgi:hypothetical protein
MKMEHTKCSETLVFKLQTPVNNPEESIRQLKQGESLKLRTHNLFSNQMNGSGG